jgi:UDP-N-acetylmuramoyl-tripeptide--D-alanyl-D-alanine ligase
VSLRASGVGAWVAFGACLAAVLPAGIRWLRVAQREHYLAGSCSRFAVRWWGRTAPNQVLALLAVAGVVLGAHWPVAALVTALVVVVGPWRLSLKGRTSALVWTRRLRLLAAVWIALQAGIAAASAALGVSVVVAAGGALLVPVILDLALLATTPVERHLANRFVATATARLGRISPIVVGITGSYGKTSTKSHVAHLVGGSRTVVATPASFNNRAGLARSINEHLTPGTEVFVAEMGTYGPGEIAELCRWCPPSIAVITAIGPVHLERFGTEERIVRAKAEITEPASTVVLNVDDPRLRDLADSLSHESRTRRIVRVASEGDGDVRLVRMGDGVTVTVVGEVVATGVPIPSSAQLTNVACAAAVALELGVPVATLTERLATLPSVEHRLSNATSANGVIVIDDTFNSNPAGVTSALGLLAHAGITGRRVVVTPGMVELGRRQRAENVRFAEATSAVATDLVVVGRTNRGALRQGASPALNELDVSTREEAVGWVRSNLSAGDAVLYENDLPDHYP